jgi:hydrogenase 3 maturation protease
MSWQIALRQHLRQSTPPERPIRLALVGIGHELRGDDGVGLDIVRRLRSRLLPPGWLALEAGSVPESCTSALRRFRPDLVVLVDAAHLDLRPGTVRWLECADTDGFHSSTHTLPLSVVATYLQTELGCAVGLLGIQPADTPIGAPLSPAVRRAASAIVSGLLETPTPKGGSLTTPWGVVGRRPRPHPDKGSVLVS